MEKKISVIFLTQGNIKLAASGAHPSLMLGAATASGILIDDEVKVVLVHETPPGHELMDMDEERR
jgi:hypothetical protein